MRVLFGHQSVGDNLLSGLAAQASMRPELALIETRTPPASADFIAHFKVGKNRDANSKLDDFVGTVLALPQASVDLALFKFCYIDIADAGMTRDLFDRYASAMEQLRAQRPDVGLAHVTVPIRQVRYGFTGTLRRLAGQRHPERARNAARESFSDRLRERFAGRVFDLAALESGIAADSKRARERALLGRYSDDGGHLNATGRREIAPQFLAFLQSSCAAEQDSRCAA